MKNNKTKKGNGKLLRLGSILLAGTLVTSVLVGSTVSKYITTGTGGTENANVAKWGVTVSTDTPDLFANSYNLATAVKDTNGTDITVGVSSSTDVVAPGTSITPVAMPISITGEPETAVSVSYSLAQTNNIKIAAGTTVGGTALTADYTPIKWTLYKNDGTAIADAGNTIDSINTYLAANPQNYAANTDLSKIGTANSYKLGWAWDFSGASSGTTGVTCDQADTYLGNAIVGGTFPTTGATTTMDITITATVTQLEPSTPTVTP